MLHGDHADLLSEGPENMGSCNTVLFQHSQWTLCGQRLNEIWTPLQGVWGHFSATRLTLNFSFGFYCLWLCSHSLETYFQRPLML